MAGRRPLKAKEERRLLRVLRRTNARDAALITTQWLTGFRISECLSLTINSVYRDGALVERIGVAPRHLKGGYGRTRWVPLLPELHRALTRHLNMMKLSLELPSDAPLFVSREGDGSGRLRPLSRESARRIVHAAFARAGIANDGRLGTHTLRKTFARKVYQSAGHDLMILKAALGHSDVAITQKYLEAQEDDVMAAIGKCDFTRGPRSPRPKIEVFPQKAVA